MEKRIWKRSVTASALIFGMYVGTADRSIAGLQGEIKPHEVSVLPEYCRFTITFSPQYDCDPQHWLSGVVLPSQGAAGSIERYSYPSG